MERLEVILKIVLRAERMGLMVFDKLSLVMDLEYADQEFGLRLEELLNADDLNFTHDVCGIQRHLNRQTKKMEDCFVPRFASSGRSVV